MSWQPVFLVWEIKGENGEGRGGGTGTEIAWILWELLVCVARQQKRKKTIPTPADFSARFDRTIVAVGIFQQSKEYI